MKKNKQMILSILYILIGVAIIAGIAFTGYSIYKKQTRKVPNPVATIEIKDYGTIKVELYPDQAPNTVTNFIRLANRGYYTDTTFFRTIPGFMIQGGDKDGKGSASLSNLKDGVEKDSNYCIPGEFLANGYTKNTVKFEEGVIGMARGDYSSISSSLTSKGYDSASAQFFIMHEDNSDSMDGLYAGFGKVLEGMDVVDKIANLEVVTREATEDSSEGVDKPVNPPVISSITVETYGIDYGEPKTLEPFDYYTWLMQNYYGAQ